VASAKWQGWNPHGRPIRAWRGVVLGTKARASGLSRQRHQV